MVLGPVKIECLRGSICALGKPVPHQTKVYRGFNLIQEQIDKWTQSTGEIVLFSAYTSTSKQQDVAWSFAKPENTNQIQCYMEIQFTYEEKPYQKALGLFDKELWPGIYFPVDIHEYS